MSVKNNLLTPRSGQPLIAPTQDFLTASFLVTQKDVFFNRSEFTRLCSYFADAMEHIEIPVPSIIKPVELWTGKQVFTVLLKPSRKNQVIVNTEVLEKNYSGKSTFMCPKDGYVVFQNSELLCGNLCKTTMGSGSKSGLIYSLVRDNSVKAAADCMLRLSKFSARWLGNYGLSIGIGDVTPREKLKKEKALLLEAGNLECSKLIESYKDGTIELKPGCNAEQTLESNLNGKLSKIRDDAGKTLLAVLPRYNAPLIMAVCGSKGSNINLSQMIACVGQQTVNGTRMPNGFQDRSLPHFLKHSKHPDAKGFVSNSFFDGLTATEFFFHTMGGREGLVDTAVKTAETGYMQRRLMKAMEDLCAKYDYSVRTSTEHLIQFQYGDDGLDPMFMDNDEQPVSLKRVFTMIQARLHDRKARVLRGEQVKQLTEKAIKECRLKNISKKFLESLRKFLNEIAKETEEIREIIEQKEKKDVEKVLLNFTHITQAQFDLFIQTVWHKYEESMITPGEAVGAVAA